MLLYFKLNIKRILKVKSKNKTYIDLSLPNHLIKIYYKLNLRFFIIFYTNNLSSISPVFISYLIYLVNN